MEIGVYRHYKGDHYQVLGVAQHIETDELMVVYISLEGAHLSGPRMRVRPLAGEDGWFSGVVHNEVVVPRFQYVGYSIKD